MPITGSEFLTNFRCDELHHYNELIRRIKKRVPQYKLYIVHSAYCGDGIPLKGCYSLHICINWHLPVNVWDHLKIYETWRYLKDHRDEVPTSRLVNWHYWV